MCEPDPYAPPATSGIVLPRPRWFRREGKFVVVRSGAVLPARCVKTNQPAAEHNATKPRQLMWVPLWARLAPSLVIPLPVLTVWTAPGWASPPAFGIAALGIAIMVFATLVFQKRVNVTYALSRQQHRWRLAVQCVALGCGVSAWLWFKANDMDSIIGFFVFLGGCVLTGVLQHPLRVVRHRDGEFWLKGASPAFLESLEEA